MAGLETKQSNRLDAGGRIDRARPITFSFDGDSYPAFFGDTLASALLANGVSPKNAARTTNFGITRKVAGVGLMSNETR